MFRSQNMRSIASTTFFLGAHSMARANLNKIGNLVKNSKGQLISKCPFGVTVGPKYQQKNWQISALAPKESSNQNNKGTLSHQIAHNCCMKVPLFFLIWPLFRCYGRNLSNFYLGILGKTMTPKGHFENNWPLPSHYQVRGINRNPPCFRSKTWKSQNLIFINKLVL